jgi:hypothetical protein
LFQSPIEENLLSFVRTLPDSDAVFVPHDAFYFSDFPAYISYLNELSKHKVVVYSDRGDFPRKPRIRNSIALRVAINPGEKLANKVLLPYNVQSLDFLPERKYGKVPRISFVGYVPKNSPGRLFKSISQAPRHPILGNGSLVRRRSLHLLSKSNNPSTIIKRSYYGAHPGTAVDFNLSRNEYIEVMSNSDFILSPRGDANQSARFYESISGGRIPIIPNSRIILPKKLADSSSIDFDKFFTSILSRSRFEKSINSIWKQISTDQNYRKFQSNLKSYFNENFEYNSYIRRVFGLELEEFLKLAGSE